jgi:putative aldouronate transport system substrate-binding protein
LSDSLPALPGTSRRGFLRGGLGLLSASAFGGVAATTLAGCGSSVGDGTASANSASVLPTYVPYSGTTPAIAAQANGVPAVYYSYPAEPVAAYPTPPLNGETISIITNIFNSVPPALGSNSAWQAVQKALGASVDFTMVGSDDYPTKLNTVIAAGDLPDMMLYVQQGAPSDIDTFLAAECEDLTPFLSGDNVKTYPHLAAIPTIAWQQCVFAGKLSMLPIPRNVTGGPGIYRKDLWSQIGVDDIGAITSADDFMAACKELTNSSKNQYALTAYTGYPMETFPLIEQSFGVPYIWRADASGNLTFMYESDEYAASVEFAAKLYAAGVFVPGCEGFTKNQMVDAFESGKAALCPDSVPSFYKYWTAMASIDPSWKIDLAVPFTASTAAKPNAWQDNVVFATTMLKKGSKERIEAVLKYADFAAAPFGTKEYLLLNYGVEGTDYTMTNGAPVLTSNGQNETQVPWKYTVAPAQPIFIAGYNACADAQHAAMARLIPMAVGNPCATLNSPADNEHGYELQTQLIATVSEIVSGKQPFSALAGAVKTWQNNGGNTIRSQYEQALASSTGKGGASSKS